MSSFLSNTEKFINEAANIARIPGDVLARLAKPDKILEFEITTDSKKFSACRVQHNNALGPYKGGIRFHPDSSLEEVEALASLMTLKNSLLGLPFGGAKGAVRVDPRALNKTELEELSRAYLRAIWRELGPQKDIPAPDVGTNPQIMDWMTDEFSKLSGRWEPAAFTGKSVEKGGSEGREFATGFGGYVILREFLKIISNFQFSISKQPTVAIQGFGNVGANIAKILFENGFKVIAISDSKGALYEESGIEINKVLDVKEKTGLIERSQCSALTCSGCPCREMKNEELLELLADVLVPAALENQITEENADKIKAKIILEMANGPVTPEAEKILGKNGIEIIPDILANGGGVVGSFLEWRQSLKSEHWTEKEVLDKIDSKLAQTFKDVFEIKKEYNTNWRMASYIKSLKRLAEAIPTKKI